ncbi:MAG TPA: hypothetical protein DGH68_09270 [Bacteroidetes bacterium]|nr:hypothetical protein [Bacteroidota bacterium]
MISEHISPRRILLLRMIDEAFEKKAWHGPNLRGSLRGISASQAAWSPGSKRHNIWEIAFHAAYWKYAVRRRILGEKRGSFPLKGSNWFRRPVEPTEEAWHADVRLLEDTHINMRQTIECIPEDTLDRIQGNTQYTYVQLICGIAAHDLYHTGQIQLLKKLQQK